MTDLFLAATLERLAASLLHFLWQGALIAVITAVALRLLVRRSPELRYIIAIGALVLMTLAPVFTFVFGATIASITKELIVAVADGIAPASPAPGTPSPGIDWQGWLLPFVAAWFAGVVFCASRLTAAWYCTVRLRRTAERALPPRIEAVFRSLQRQLGFARQVKLMVSDRIGSPLVAGWLCPIVLLPVTAITGLNEDQLRAVLAHELAHIRRHDFLVNVMQRCIESILFYHPAVWWLSARIRAEREHCCDDLAVRVCGDPFIYAQALVELERVRTAIPHLAVAAAGKGLTRRVLRLLHRESGSSDWRETVLVWAFLLTVVIAALWPSNTAVAQPLVIPRPEAGILQPVVPAAETPSPTSITRNVLPKTRALLLAL